MTDRTEPTSNSRVYTNHGDIKFPSDIDPHKNYLFDASYLGILKIGGANAADFLQGQLTCDVTALSDTQMVQGAQCSLKGRILALVDIIQWQGVLLILPKDILEATQKSLSKTAQLSRVSLSASDELMVFGFYLQNAQDLLPYPGHYPKEPHAQNSTHDLCYYHLGNGFYIFMVRKADAALFSAPFVEKNQYAGSALWHTLRLMDKQLTIYPESRDLFLPHRLGLHETDLISFNKGCYKGQEIIARTHYRATLKHEMKWCTAVLTQEPFSGQKVYDPMDGHEIGEIVDYSRLDENRYIIALSMLKQATYTVRLEHQTEATTLALLQ